MSWVPLACLGAEVVFIVIAGFVGWLKPFFTDHKGEFSSALFWRNVWQLALLNMVGYQTLTKGVGLDVLGFAAGMAGAGEFVYNWRRGQDRKLEATRGSRSEEM